MSIFNNLNYPLILSFDININQLFFIKYKRMLEQCYKRRIELIKKYRQMTGEFLDENSRLETIKDAIELSENCELMREYNYMIDQCSNLKNELIQKYHQMTGEFLDENTKLQQIKKAIEFVNIDQVDQLKRLFNEVLKFHCATQIDKNYIKEFELTPELGDGQYLSPEYKQRQIGGKFLRNFLRGQKISDDNKAFAEVMNFYLVNKNAGSFLRSKSKSDFIDHYLTLVWEIQQCKEMLDLWLNDAKETENDVYQEYMQTRYQEINFLISQYAPTEPRNMDDVKHLLYLYSTFTQYCFLYKDVFDQLFQQKVQKGALITDTRWIYGPEKSKEDHLKIIQEKIELASPVVYVKNTSLIQLFVYFIYLCKVHKLMDFEPQIKKSYNIFKCIEQLTKTQNNSTQHKVKIIEYPLNNRLNKNAFEVLLSYNDKTQSANKLISFGDHHNDSMNLETLKTRLEKLLKVNDKATDSKYWGGYPQKFHAYKSNKIIQFCNYLDILREGTELSSAIDNKILQNGGYSQKYMVNKPPQYKPPLLRRSDQRY